MSTRLQVCSRCVMDTTAEEITFDSQGVCSFCHTFDRRIKPILERNRRGEGRDLLQAVVEQMKRAGQGKPYDCLIGLSGGADSSYMIHVVSTLGLRPLVTSVDTGWGTPEADSNVELLVSKLGLEFEKRTLDWSAMRDIQIAFYKASIRNCEIPQDQVFLAEMYKLASARGIRFVLLGSNHATESILPESWGYNAADVRYIRDVCRKFGDKRCLDRLPTMNLFERYVYYPFLRGIHEVRPLNYVPYVKKEAKALLADEYGWQDYGAKHYESVLTRFFQGYYLPTKFGVDKRKAHLSSLILAGEITRDDALRELQRPPYDADRLLEDKEIIARRLELPRAEWERILALPPRPDSEFRSARWGFALKERIARMRLLPSRRA